MQEVAQFKNTRLSRTDSQWVNEQVLKFDDSLRQNFNKGKYEFLRGVTYFLSNSTSAISAVFYELNEKEQRLFKVAGYAVKFKDSESVGLGETIVGQCAKNQESVLFQEIPEEYATIYIANSKLDVKGLLVTPLVFNNKTYGVIELRYLKDIPKRVINFVTRAANNTAVLMESIRKSEETEQQKEELAKQELFLRENIQDLQKAKTELQEQNTLVENTLELLSQQNKRVEESINYAKRIQQSILPSKEALSKFFRDSFVIFKPKDMVSGDFYWQAEYGNYCFLAVIDCTGHGVPGAFMSMIGNTLLNQIILEKKVSEPSEILSQLHQGIGLNLVQTDGNYRDGMDMMLCRFEKKGKGYHEMVASGAKSYLFTIIDGEVESLKGDSQSIGGDSKNGDILFNQSEFQLPAKSRVILTTDGWIDNANNRRRRYGAKRFKKALQSNTGLTLNGLKTRLQEDMVQYQGENDEQRDDITVLGIEL